MGAPAVVSPLGFAERIQLFLQRVEYRRAESDEDRQAIFRLRYEAYLREGAIVPNFGRSFSDAHDDDDNSWIIGLHVDGRLASSFRVHVGNRDFADIPAMQVFADFLEPELEAGKIVVDPTRFVVDQRLAVRHPELAYLTVRIGHMAAEYFAADIVLATVRAEHQAFYRRVFGHAPVCPPRPYPGLTKPISLMMLDVNQSRPIINARYPFFVSSPAERAEVFGPLPQMLDKLRRTVAGNVRPLAG
jgi:hypothetical protein